MVFAQTASDLGARWRVRSGRLDDELNEQHEGPRLSVRRRGVRRRDNRVKRRWPSASEEDRLANAQARQALEAEAEFQNP
jgi:hypothetical protein